MRTRDSCPSTSRPLPRQETKASSFFQISSWLPHRVFSSWAFFRRSAVRLPYIGANYSVVYPYRTSLLYSDSIPLLALLFKPFGALLPATFQYMGLWGLASFALQGLLAQKIAWRISGAEERGIAVQAGTVAASVLALLYPVLTIRMFAHTALAGNWLILLGLWLWLCCRGGVVRSCLWWGLAGILCVGVHQYYLPMVGICAVGYAAARLMRKDGPAPALLPILSFCGCALAELFVLGAFSGNFANTDPSGWFTGADPLNLIVPGLYSTWEVDIFVGWGILLAAVLALAAGAALCLLRPAGLAGRVSASGCGRRTAAAVRPGRRAGRTDPVYCGAGRLAGRGAGRPVPDFPYRQPVCLGVAAGGRRLADAGRERPL